MPRFRPPCRAPDSGRRPVGRKCCPTGVAQAGLQPCAQRGTMECSVGGMVSTQCLYSRTFQCKQRKRHPASRERHCDSVGQLKGNKGSTVRKAQRQSVPLLWQSTTHSVPYKQGISLSQF